MKGGLRGREVRRRPGRTDGLRRKPTAPVSKAKVHFQKGGWRGKSQEKKDSQRSKKRECGGSADSTEVNALLSSPPVPWERDRRAE